MCCACRRPAGGSEHEVLYHWGPFGNIIQLDLFIVFFCRQHIIHIKNTMITGGGSYLNNKKGRQRKKYESFPLSLLATIFFN
jgi:hypothetical protein